MPCFVMYKKDMESLGLFILPKEEILEITKVKEMASKQLLLYFTTKNRIVL